MLRVPASFNKTNCMKKELYIHIPKPCQEDWQQMTPVTNGRYCDSCAKQVVDFSTMSDVEVLNFLSRSTGKLCGRFSTDQLQRPLQPTKEEPRKSLWLAAFMPLLLLFDRSSAQRKATEKTPTTISPVDQNQALMGKVLPPDHSKDVHKSKEKTMSPHPQIKKEKFTEMNMVLGDIGFKPFTEQKPANTLLKQQAEKIKGFVKDANSHPVANAFVQVKGTGHFANTDSAGYFEIPAAQLNNDATLNISCIGYIAKDWPVIHDDYTTQNILLEEKVSNLPEVTVTSFESTTCRRLVVGITSVIVQRIKNDTIPTLIRKARIPL